MQKVRMYGAVATLLYNIGQGSVHVYPRVFFSDQWSSLRILLSYRTVKKQSCLLPEGLSRVDTSLVLGIYFKRRKTPPNLLTCSGSHAYIHPLIPTTARPRVPPGYKHTRYRYLLNGFEGADPWARPVGQTRGSG